MGRTAFGTAVVAPLQCKLCSFRFISPSLPRFNVMIILFLSVFSFLIRNVPIPSSQVCQRVAKCQNPAGHSSTPSRMLASVRYAFVLLLACTITSCAEDEVVETLTEATPTSATTTSTSTPASSQPNIAFDFFYREGVSMYLQEEWEDCVKNLKQALQGWHHWNDNTARLVHCLVLCVAVSNERK